MPAASSSEGTHASKKRRGGARRILLHCRPACLHHWVVPCTLPRPPAFFFRPAAAARGAQGSAAYVRHLRCPLQRVALGTPSSLPAWSTRGAPTLLETC